MFREKNYEREPNKRESPFKEHEHEPWIKVSRKKTPNRLPPPPSFENNFHISPPIWYHILKYPKPLQKIWGNCNRRHTPIQRPHMKFRYAFIRYVNPSSLQATILAINGVKLERMKLKVQLAKFDKPVPNPRTALPTLHHPNHHQKNPPIWNQLSVITCHIKNSAFLKPNILNLDKSQKTPHPPIYMRKPHLYPNFMNQTPNLIFSTKTPQKLES